MATSSIVYVSTTPVLVTPAGVHSGVDLTIQNQGSSGQYIYVGDENVSSTNYGIKIGYGEGFGLTVPARDSIYVVGSTSNIPLSILTLGLP